MSFKGIKSSVEQYYSRKFKQHGATHAGVDWNSRESQQVRFDQLVKICDAGPPFVINDLGCGYGAFYEYLLMRGYRMQYRGYDLSETMIDHAKLQYGSKNDCSFAVGDDLAPADYAVASGIFNVKVDKSDAEWQQYVLDTISRMDAASMRGFAFNVLTIYSDADRMLKGLYYADPCFYFDYCKRRFSKNVALLHDYGLYEFTILVRKG